MRIWPGEELQLTYCTNIHPCDGLDSVLHSLGFYAPALKAQFSPSAPFGIGLRLSAREASELLEGTRLNDFRAFLADEGLYVALLNGFPYGRFHGGPVKADVYAPDWRAEARLRYTLDLVRILGHLLPEGMEGGISTAPLSYKPWMRNADREGWRTVTHNLIHVAKDLVRLRERSGKFIHLDIEPEPDCVLETSEETVAFFEERLLTEGATMLAEGLGVGAEIARNQVLDHLQVCFDCCHFAVGYEDPRVALARFERAGVRIGRIQLSSALHVPLPPEPERVSAMTERLQAFADDVYLHQVVERRPDGLHHYSDLSVALQRGPHPSANEWRIHFHVPLFAGEYDSFGSTRAGIQEVLRAVLETRPTRHLEIETYTWEILPGGLKIDLLHSISREYEWVLGELSREGGRARGGTPASADSGGVRARIPHGESGGTRHENAEE